VIDPFTFIVIGGLVAGLIAILALGRFYPGSGAEVLDWKPTRSPEDEVRREQRELDERAARFRAEHEPPPSEEWRGS
jgi:hypothetical protein